jgi:hypothetical protein
MSFPEIAPMHRATYTEAIYAQNMLPEDRRPLPWLLTNLLEADSRRVSRNFRIMASRGVLTYHLGCVTVTENTSMLDFFPGLEEWMFLELHEVLGNQRLYEIASRFGQDPYTYRAGWPDLTIWRNGEVRFVEVKGPGDRVHASQRRLLSGVLQPLGLSVTLLEVSAEGAVQ